MPFSVNDYTVECEYKYVVENSYQMQLPLKTRLLYFKRTVVCVSCLQKMFNECWPNESTEEDISSQHSPKRG